METLCFVLCFVSFPDQFRVVSSDWAEARRKPVSKGVGLGSLDGQPRPQIGCFSTLLPPGCAGSSGPWVPPQVTALGLPLGLRVAGGAAGGRPFLDEGDVRGHGRALGAGPRGEPVLGTGGAARSGGGALGAPCVHGSPPRNMDEDWNGDKGRGRDRDWAGDENGDKAEDGAGAGD